LFTSKGSVIDKKPAQVKSSIELQLDHNRIDQLASVGRPDVDGTGFGALPGFRVL
jgi:hypothetical protein